MTTPQKLYEEKLAELWQAHFGQPMPMHGAYDIVSKILEEGGVQTPKPPPPAPAPGQPSGQSKR
jgi:hypothetical protein